MDSDDVREQIDPENYYDDLGEDEWERLERTEKATFEFENTTDYLDEYLPESGRVLDVGGAAGRYAIWLAERGYDVTLADLSAVQLDVAREKVREHGVEDRVEVECADVRALPYADDAFDATCCLGGPLSHVVEAEEREGAVRELQRVTQPGGPVFASVMGFVAVVQNLIKSAPEFPQGVRQLSDLVETGTYDPDLVAKHGIEDPSFVACHFFRADELRDLLETNGIEVAVVAGLEGPASNYDEEVEGASEADQERIREVVRQVREDPTFADLSNHILAVGRVR
jgi:SAM-dependent methyltransferase